MSLDSKRINGSRNLAEPMWCPCSGGCGFTCAKTCSGCRGSCQATCSGAFMIYPVSNNDEVE